MRTQEQLTLVAAAVVAVALSGLGVINCDDFVIESPPITEWGDWGLQQKCLNGSYVFGFRLKTEPPQGLFTDDTALNGIELLCIDASMKRSPSKATTSITSTVGRFGTFGSIKECVDPEWANGFQLKSERTQTGLDNSAGNDMRLLCTDGVTLEGDGVTEWGDWTAVQTCPRGTVVCGIQTQVETADVTDETALNNVRMVCCDRP